MSKNGYLYVYMSNESPQDVFFDDVTVKHYTGALVQEQSYYPFGLQMAAISDKALKKNNTPYKYNDGSELEEELNYYSTFFRKYDAQIGRFTGIDILGEQTNGLSPYHYGGNNPIFFNDPTGAKYNSITHRDDLTDKFSAFDNEGYINWNYTGGGRHSGIYTSKDGNTIEFVGEEAKKAGSEFLYALTHPNSKGQWSFTINITAKGNVSYWVSTQKAQLAIFFTGADFGQGMTPSTLQIMNQIVNANPGIEATTYSSAYYLDEEEGTNSAFNQVTSFVNLNPDGTIVLYGYSYGGVLVNFLADRLFDTGISITYMATVDAANGPLSNWVDRFIGRNVGWNDNFYQLGSDASGSHGDLNNGYNVHNYLMSGVTHYSIDDVTIPIVLSNMNSFLSR